MELQERHEELRQQGVGVVAISYDSEEVLAAFAERKSITTLPLLSDDDSSVIRRFGIYNTVAEEGVGPNADNADVKADVEKYVSVFGASQTIVGTPYPGTFIVDRQGRVTARFFEEFYRERNTAANIMLKLGSPVSPISGMRGDTPYLSIGAYQSNSTITVGSRFHLGIEIELKTDIHVYAPGAQELGYRVIELSLEVPDFIQTLPVVYPSSEIYHFEPLDEHVPVYLKPFNIVQEMVVAGSPAASETLESLDVVTLAGRLDYQACDDEVCFSPVSIPLTWTLAVDPLDRQRVESPE